ncbi:MAG: GNAT family protein, partial [Chloroflexota bacterium]
KRLRTKFVAVGGDSTTGERRAQVSVIYGEKVRLRAVERDDVKKYFEWVNDPEVTHGLALYLPMSTTDEEKWFERATNRDPNEKPLAIEMRDGEGWRLIGNCAFFDIDTVARSGEIGIMIGDKSVWNKGLGTEAMGLLLLHGFETLNLNRVMLKVYAYNARAIRAYEKAGFKREGALRQAVFKHGKYDDVHIMSVLRSEWDARKAEGR